MVEEPSMEAALETLMPKILPSGGPSWAIYVFQGKQDLLRKLPERLAAYARWLPDTARLVVVIDRDGDDCRVLKKRLDDMAVKAGMKTRSARAAQWQVVNRLAIEELEAWFLGDPDAVRAAFPKVSSTFERKAGMRDPDDISGGTWEALERVLQAAGYFPGGLQKIAAAQAIAAHMDPMRNRSASFRALRDVLLEVTGAPTPAKVGPVQSSLPLRLTGAPTALERLRQGATALDSAWGARILWALEWARRAGLGGLRPSDLGRLLRDKGGLHVEDTNVARAFRDLRGKNASARVWTSIGGRHTITNVGSDLLATLIATPDP